MEKGAVVNMKINEKKDKLIIIGDDESPLVLNYT
jgi:hypothetical protein